jgi:hypothetical protein
VADDPGGGAARREGLMDKTDQLANKIREAIISEPMTDWDRVFWAKKIWMKPMKRIPFKTESDLVAEAINDSREPLPRHRRLRVEELARRWDSVCGGWPKEAVYAT